MDVAGKKIVLTGAFSTKRAELATALAERGAIVAGSLSAKTDLLIVGRRAGSKLARAERLGVPVLTEADLSKILATPATVEVAPEPAKVARLPARWADSTFPDFAGKTYCLTGTLRSMKRAELKALLEANGAKVVPTPTRTTDCMISGEKWGRKVRDAIAKGVPVISEGQLILELQGRCDFPDDEDVPNGENLSKLPVLEEGELTIRGPANAEQPLVLRWKKVAFTPHRRFLELFGFSFAGDVQYVGVLYHGDTRLAPADLYDIYGAESWRRSLFWECGSDFDDESLVYSGEHGFNCTPLVNLGAVGASKLKWKKTGWSGSSTRMTEFYGESYDYGDVCTDEPNHWLLVNIEKGQFAWNVHTGPYIINPSDPYGS